MSMLLPVCYMLAGWLWGRWGGDGRQLASKILSRYVIPVVIAWNVATQFTLMSVMLLVSMAAMAIVFAIGRFIMRDVVQQLCLCYLNIGWLGLPIGSLLFGEQAASLMIAAYVGSSIFGNTLGAGLLSARRISLQQLVMSPPLLSVAAGILLIPAHAVLTTYATELYGYAKLLMSILGMGILGLWLSATRLQIKDVHSAALSTLYRIGLWATLIVVTGIAIRCTGVVLTPAQWKTLLLISLLPPAANIIVLETHYAGTGHSAPTILWGTLISLVLIAIYATTLTLL